MKNTEANNGSKIPLSELEERTAEFEKMFFTFAKGDGMMVEDIFFMAKSYGVEPPYEEIE